MNDLRMAVDAVDHLVVAAADLNHAITVFEQRTGVRASPGGRHPRWGTHNALLSIGTGAYLELIAPDPDREDGVVPRVFGVHQAAEPRLVAWAVGVDRLEPVITRASRCGVHLGGVLEGSRQRPGGGDLSWRLTDPEVVVEYGVVPFLIEWGATAHPSVDAAPAGQLVELRAEHPHEQRLTHALAALSLQLDVRHADAAAMSAILETPRGKVEVR